MITTYFNKLVHVLHSIDKKEIQKVAECINSCKGTIFIFGNGGSATTASHFAQDMNHLTNKRVICLNDNVPSLLAYGNDVGFAYIFALQLERLLQVEDIVIGISCSGNSPNVIRAIGHAKDFGNLTIGLTGFDGGRIRELVDYGIYVPCYDMQICEDIHLMLTHLLMRLINETTSCKSSDN